MPRKKSPVTGDRSRDPPTSSAVPSTPPQAPGGRFQAHTVPDNVHQLRVQTTFHVWKTRGCQCSFRLLTMGGVSPETCWASYKYGIMKFWYIVASCWIFLYELYYDARIHERHEIFYSSFQSIHNAQPYFFTRYWEAEKAEYNIPAQTAQRRYCVMTSHSSWTSYLQRPVPEPRSTHRFP